MNIWRIGSNWGGIDILPVFKEHQIAFAGLEVAYYVDDIMEGDIVAVTAGQSIVAVGKSVGLGRLPEYNEDYIDDYADVPVIKLEPYYFSDEWPQVDFGIYAGQGKQFHKAGTFYSNQISELFNSVKIKTMQKQIRFLLDFKKQIILQGPPGTGKTRMAKLIAEEMIKPMSITIQDINDNIKVGTTFISSSKYTEYTVESVNNSKVMVKTMSGKSYPATINKIIEAYAKKLWLGGLVNGNDSYDAAVAKYIYEKIGSDQYNIIQFHPAYSYEDFVRGITAKPAGKGVEYKTENRVLAEFAGIAHKNFIESKKDVQVISKDRWLEEMFEEFKDSIEVELDEAGKYSISRSAQIFDADESAFKYTGDNWSTNFRMPFSDILRLYSLGVTERKQIKKQPDVSGRARQHATYYFNVLKKFNEFLAGKSYVEQLDEKPEEKKYILIIDEINRANLPAVLGELIYALEYRSEAVESMYELDESRKIIIPPNLYIIGTMNTADRSVGHIDYAIRRRFAFVDVLPKEIPELTAKGKKLFQKIALLFCEKFEEGKSDLKNSKYLAADFKPTDVILGHSYFLIKEDDKKTLGKTDDEILEMKLTYEIMPLLREYVKDGILTKEVEQHFKPTLAEWLNP